MTVNNKKVVLIGNTASSLLGFRLDMIKQLICLGYEVYTFTSEYSSNELEQLRELGCIPIPYQMSRGGLNPIADLSSLIQLTKKIKQLRPDIVFSYMVKPVIYGSIAAKLAKIPHIIGMLEGLGYTFTEQPQGQTIKTKIIRNIQVLLYRLAFPCLDQIIFLNSDDKQDLMDRYRLFVPETHILGGIGLDLIQFPYTEAKTLPIKFLFIGRLLKEKGVFELIEAIRLVKRKYPSAHFTILGAIDHENLGALKQEILDQLLQENLFEYPGHVSNIQDWIKDTSVFILPSYREGVPRSTQEAMAIGRPIITTDAPGCRETVIDGVNGFLVPKWNIQALADKMCYFIEHPEQVNIMGMRSREIAQEKFDVNRVNEKLFEIMGLSAENEKVR